MLEYLVNLYIFGAWGVYMDDIAHIICQILNILFNIKMIKIYVIYVSTTVSLPHIIYMSCCGGNNHHSMSDNPDFNNI